MAWRSSAFPVELYVPPQKLRLIFACDKLEPQLDGFPPEEVDLTLGDDGRRRTLRRGRRTACRSGAFGTQAGLV